MNREENKHKFYFLLQDTHTLKTCLGKVARVNKPFSRSQVLFYFFDVIASLPPLLIVTCRRKHFSLLMMWKRLLPIYLVTYLCTSSRKMYTHKTTNKTYSFEQVATPPAKKVKVALGGFYLISALHNLISSPFQITSIIYLSVR